MLLLWYLWPVLLSLASAMDTCVIGQSTSSHKVSTALESLHCYNDYKSFHHCTWKEERHTNKSLQLWFKDNDSSRLCEPYSSPVNGTSQCRYKTKIFALGTTYTAFFNETLSVCSSVQQQFLNLSLHLRAHPPVNLTTSRTEDGGHLITWSSPYPASSALNRNITYKLSHRAHGQDNWTTEELSDPLKKLEKKLLTPGHRYEARVKARVSIGHWSHWTPVVSWHTEPDPGQVPSVECVVSGEQEVMCSWEVSRELVHFISYQLACRPNPSAPSYNCCKEPVVSPSYRHTVLRYSCVLTVPSTHLLLELKPTRNSKTFRPSKHIRPYPPTQVNVSENGQNWIVEWTPQKMEPFLYSEVCYYSKQDEDSVTCVDIPESSTSLNILRSSLHPSQSYMVKVRSLVRSNNGYEGIPSDWSLPVEWTSHTAVWSISNWIYVSISVMVVAVFLTLYRTIPACRRRAVLWVESVPSPGKSKIMSDIQSVNIREMISSENTYISKVFGMDTVSTCSLSASLWSTKDTEGECLEVDEDSWNCCNLPVTFPDTSTNSFSGPYIFCQEFMSQVVESKPMDNSFDQKEESSPVLGSPNAVDSGVFEEGYVCLPGHCASRSIQDLTSQSHSSTDEQRKDSPEPELHCSNDTSGTFWPTGGTIPGSGYCQLPTDFMRTQQ